MMKRLEIGGNPIGVEVSAREQRDLITSHVLAIQNKFDAKVAERIGFGGNIMEELLSAYREDNRGVALPLKKYLTQGPRKAMHISSRRRDEEFVYSMRYEYADGTRTVHLAARGIDMTLRFDEEERLRLLDAQGLDRGIVADLTRPFPLRLTRGHVSAEYHNVNEKGDFELADEGKIQPTVTRSDVVIYSLKEKAVVDWEGELPVIEVEGDALALRDDYDSQPVLLPLKANIYDELQVV